MSRQPPPFTVDYPRQVDLRALQKAYERLNSLQHQLNSIPTTLTDAQLAQVKATIGETAHNALSVGGSNPLLISSIPGATGAIPSISAGTHAARPSASGLPSASLYFETDRTVYYQLIAGQWAYTAGIMFAPIASRPSDLAVPDTDFLFHATDRRLTYQWSGTVWAILITYEPVIADTLANWTTLNYSPANYASGQQFLVTTWAVTYTVEAGVWTYTSGTYIAPAASRPTTGFNGAALGTADKGLLFLASDTLATSYWTGAAWVAYPTVSGAAPTGPAGGDLGGTYPNPTVRQASGSFVMLGAATQQNLAGNAVFNINIAAGDYASVVLEEAGTGRAQFCIAAGNSYWDYYGVLYIRNAFSSGSPVITVDATGNVTLAQMLTLTGRAVAALPGAPVVGTIAFVNNALAPAAGSPVAGGGAANALVWWNGTHWNVFAI